MAVTWRLPHRLPGDLYAEFSKPAKTTTIAYRDVLAQLWMLDPLPGWVPTRTRLTRLMQAPKHRLADPALAGDSDVRNLLCGISSYPRTTAAGQAACRCGRWPLSNCAAVR